VENDLEVGQRVKFNVGKADGPLYYGCVTSKLRNGNIVILPEHATQLGATQFFNIRKAEDVPVDSKRR
jgi:hypothetical protein